MGIYSTPKQDPLMGVAAYQTALTGQQQFELGKEEIAFQREQYNKLAPMYEQLMKESIDASSADRARSDSAWSFYNDNFKPIEAKVASEAMTYDSPEETAKRAAAAAGTVQGQIDSSRAQVTRDAARMGLSPERTVAAMTDDANFTGLAKAGAVNQERTNTKLLGMQMRQDAANLGRGQAQIGITTGQAALQNGQGASGFAGSQASNRSAGLASGNNFLNSGVNSYGTAASILDRQFDNNLAAQSQKQNMMGAIGGAALRVVNPFGAFGAGGMFGTSDVNAKENIAPVDPEAALDGLRRVPVSQWTYKEGQGDGGTHIGPMAQDVNAQFGEQAAPGGVAIDLISENGIHKAAIQALAAKVDAIEVAMTPRKSGPKSGARDSIPMIDLGLERV
jgi:hypothetical protein